MNNQSLDQTVKGALVGVLTWALVRWEVDPMLIGAAGTIAMAVLAEVSKRVGVKGVALPRNRRLERCSFRLR